MTEARRYRIALLLIGVPQLGAGLWALFAPRSWYDDFPGGGRDWIATLGPYDEHLAVDVGSTLTALGILLVVAAVVLERRVVQVACAVYLAWAVPHFVYHLTRLGDLPAGDDIANTITTGLTVAVPAAVLAMAARLEHVPTTRKEPA